MTPHPHPHPHSHSHPHPHPPKKQFPAPRAPTVSPKISNCRKPGSRPLGGLGGGGVWIGTGRPPRGGCGWGLGVSSRVGVGVGGLRVVQILHMPNGGRAIYPLDHSATMHTHCSPSLVGCQDFVPKFAMVLRNSCQIFTAANFCYFKFCMFQILPPSRTPSAQNFVESSEIGEKHKKNRALTRPLGRTLADGILS